MMDTATAPHAAAATATAVPLLRTVLLCDLVDSTALVARLGDARAAELLRRHDRRVRQLLVEYGGRGIDKADGFLALFERPIQAVACALAYQRALRALGAAEQVSLSARVGIHVGDVLLWENAAEDVAHGAAPVEVEGLAKPVAARLMQLALPGQILLSGVAHSLALRAAAELGEAAERARWQTHGRFHFKGVPAPMLVHEVGEAGVAPLRVPPSTAKAWRDVPMWRRPATVALEVLAVAVLSAVAIFVGLRSSPAIAFRERDWVVVGDLNNLTSDIRFEDSLETALRIGLEQSRFVNLLPELRVRDALTRMGRDPDTSVDRNIGAEIALREGARALLVPTVAEVGGKLRVSLEVVDPNTQATVLTKSADADGAGSVLDSLDQVSEGLRASLGESMADIKQASAPLDQVTTPNLDALRAFVTGQRAVNAGRLDEAQNAFEQSLSLDPDFAMARLGLAKIHWAKHEFAAMTREVEQALAKQERLTARERLYADALNATATLKPGLAGKWETLANLYPDFHIAAHNYAVFGGWYEGRFDAMGEYAERASVPNSITRHASTYLRALALLGQEQHEAAIASFKEAAELGFRDFIAEHAAAFAAARRFDEAKRLLQSAPAARVPAIALSRGIVTVAVSLDSGEWSTGWQQARELSAQASSTGAANAWAARAAVLSSNRGVADVRERRVGISELVDLGGAALTQAAGADAESIAIAVAFGGYLAAREGDVATAERAISIVEPVTKDMSRDQVMLLMAITRARMAMLKENYSLARRLLQPQNSDRGLLLGKALMAELNSAEGRHDEALRDFDWLASHRGRAYAEWSGDYVLMTENVIQANRALLRGAEVALAMGDDEGAARRLAQFRSAWKDLSPIPDLAERADEVSRRLAESSNAD